jgi:hypothetical protein
MDMASNSQKRSKTVETESLGRPRKRPIGEDTSLSFRVGDALVRALDEEVEAMNAEQEPGRPVLSRGDVVRILLHEGIAAHAKARSVSRSRQ